jgi:sugar phosphate isomerase/epimerase
MKSKKKLAFTTIGCTEWTFARVLDEAQKMGYSGIEIRGLENKMGIDEVEYFSPANKESTLAALKEHSLEIIGFGSSIRFDDAAKFDSMVSEGKRAIDVCHFMGIPAVRIFGDRFPPGEPESHLIARAAKGFEILAEYGEGKGVLVLLETHGDFKTLKEVKGVFDLVKSGNFRLLWDVGHTDLFYRDDFMEFYKPMKELISHTHIRDCIRGEPGDEKTCKPCLAGEGQVPIRAIVEQLLSDGYNGYFSFEWEKKWHPDLPGAEIAFPEFVRFMNDF